MIRVSTDVRIPSEVRRLTQFPPSSTPCQPSEIDQDIEQYIAKEAKEVRESFCGVGASC